MPDKDFVYAVIVPNLLALVAFGSIILSIGSAPLTWARFAVAAVVALVVGIGGSAAVIKYRDRRWDTDGRTQSSSRGA